MVRNFCRRLFFRFIDISYFDYFVRELVFSAIVQDLFFLLGTNFCIFANSEEA